MSMSPKDFEELIRLTVEHGVLTKEVELLRQQIKLYDEQVAALKEANTALRELALRSSQPFGIPLTPYLSQQHTCVMCGAPGGHNGLPCPTTAPYS